MSNWKQRRVCFVLADAYNAMTLANITMPVRETDMVDGMSRYEGPVETMWAKVKERLPNAEELDLVGVLIASSSQMDMGNITWLSNSVHQGSQLGADKIKEGV